MDTTTVITLLTIAVILLSVVIITIIVIAIVLGLKITKLVRNVTHISSNVAAATEWLSPAKLFGEAFKLIKNRK